MHKGFVTQFSFSGVALAALCTASSVYAEPMPTGADANVVEAQPPAVETQPPVLATPATEEATPRPVTMPPTASQTPSQPAAAPQMAEPTREVSTKTVTLPNGADVGGGPSNSLPNKKLLRNSSILFAASYVPTFFVAMAKSKETDGTLFIPVVGPFIEIGNDTSAGNKALLVFSGVAQSLGVAGAITSFFLPESRTEKIPGMGKRKVRVDAVAGRSDYRLTLAGQF